MCNRVMIKFTSSRGVHGDKREISLHRNMNHGPLYRTVTFFHNANKRLYIDKFREFNKPFNDI